MNRDIILTGKSKTKRYVGRGSNFLLIKTHILPTKFSKNKKKRLWLEFLINNN